MKKSLEQKTLESRAKCTSKELYSGKVFSVRRDTLEFDDHHYNWEFVIHPGAVMAVPVAPNGKLILIQQWRRAIGQIIYELPAGVPHQNEAPRDAIDRELQEEIGYKAGTLLDLGGFYSSPGFCNEYIHLFIAKDLTQSTLPADLHEAIDIIEMDLTDALTLIDEGQILDMKTVAGLLRYHRWHASQ